MNVQGGARECGHRVWPNITIWLLGGVFLAGAALKSLSWVDFAVLISYYGVLRAPWVLQWAALGLIGLEAGLGMALLLRWKLRSLALPATLALLTAFTLLIGWAWTFRGLKDCGCFGKYLPIGPGESMAKNLIMIAMAVAVWRGEITQKALPDQTAVGPVPDGGRRSDRGKGDRIPGSGAQNRGRHLLRRWREGAICAAAASMVAFASVGVPVQGAGPSSRDDLVSLRSSSRQDSGAFAGYVAEYGGQRADLARGRYIVAMLSDSCEHCADTVAALNAFHNRLGMPPVVGLILGEEDTLKTFRSKYKPEFPTRLIPVLEFLDLIGDAPPRFYLVQDGRAVRHWDSEDVPNAGVFLNSAGR